ncbi:hypothetical protein LCGC14_2111820 [marine sediment metagenome]|uniref:Uncharacterized protein n=1 Tax=marine sediment metagenome TaxID=412755 RepID=A0A0F9EU19_9ZZZZ
MTQIIESKLRKSSNDQIWLNPVDNMVYSTVFQPEHGFTNEVGATKIYDPTVASHNRDIIAEASMNGTLTQNLVDALATPYHDPELQQASMQYDTLIKNNRIKEAAMLSTENRDVDVVKVFERLFGLKDRNYAGVELFERVPTEELVLNFDKVLKQNGMEQIPENTLPRNKEIEYKRVTLNTKKYGLMSRVTDEAIRRNVHNPFQDSITTASTKLMQRKAFDVITEALAALPSTPALDDWEAFVANTDRSVVDPTKDILRVVNNTIEGTNVGGKFNTIGVNAIVGKIYDNNSYLRGTIEPTPSFEPAPGTHPARALPGVTTVQDQFIDQGIAILVDNGVESCGIMLEGPTRVATKTDELTGTQTYVTMSHHLGRVINPDTGRIITGVAVPIAPA